MTEFEDKAIRGLAALVNNQKEIISNQKEIVKYLKENTLHAQQIAMATTSADGHLSAIKGFCAVLQAQVIRICNGLRSGKYEI